MFHFNNTLALTLVLTVNASFSSQAPLRFEATAAWKKQVTEQTDAVAKAFAQQQNQIDAKTIAKLEKKVKKLEARRAKLEHRKQMLLAQHNDQDTSSDVSSLVELESISSMPETEVVESASKIL